MTVENFEVSCPHCHARLKIAPVCLGRHVRCGRCEREFEATVPTPPPTAPLPSSQSNITLKRPQRQRKSGWSPDGFVISIFVVLGVAVGIVFGYYAGHHFPFFGGIPAMLGEPHSPARSMIARGHMLVFGALFALLGLLIGLLPPKARIVMFWIPLLLLLAAIIIGVIDQDFLEKVQHMPS